MNNKTSARIELILGDRAIDLQVPIQVTEKRLIELIKRNLPQLGIRLPNDWALELVGKNTKLNQNLTLSNYPISDGDRFKIQIERQEGEHDAN